MPAPDNVTAVRPKDTKWCWYEKHQTAFDALKKAHVSPPTLTYYDINKPVKITCDASQHGLGAACLQDGSPIAYASRTLTPTEKRCAQVEKELLAVVFASSNPRLCLQQTHTE